ATLPTADRGAGHGLEALSVGRRSHRCRAATVSGVGLATWTPLAAMGAELSWERANTAVWFQRATTTRKLVALRATRIKIGYADLKVCSRHSDVTRSNSNHLRRIRWTGSVFRTLRGNK